MVEQIGLVSQNLPLSPDAPFVKRNREVLDRQARFLEESGVADSLKLAVEVIPGASFYYSDSAEITSGELLPGYTLLGREQNVPTKDYANNQGVETQVVGVVISPDIKGGLLRASHFKRHLKFSPNDEQIDTHYLASIEYMYPGFSTETKDRRQMILNLFTYIEKTGLVPQEDAPQVLVELAKRK